MRPSLLDNPFAILKVTASATNEDIVDAHDDLSGSGDVDDAKLIEARQALLSPRTRLGAELAFLTDTSEAEARRLLNLLGTSVDRSSLTSAAERLSPLSRANFLVALIENFGLTDDLLVKLISAQAEIVVGDVVEVLRRVRTKAGIVTPNDESVAQALEGLFEQQARAVLKTESDPSSLAQIVTAATAAICATNDADRFERLDSIQQAYWRTVSRETAVLRSDLEAIGARLLDECKDADVEAYIGALRRWDVFGQPLQVLERTRGRQDQEALAVQTSVRGLCLDLSNEKRRSDAALKITKAAREVFAELDRAAETLTEDVDILIGNAAIEATRPLEVVLDRLRRSLDAFARGIEAGKTGPGTEWAKLFDTLAETLPKTPGQDRPWIMLRSLGIDMFNATGAEGATRTFVNAVLERARASSAAPDIIKRLEDDLVDLDRFGAQKRLSKALETKKWDEALTLAKGMEASARTPDERKEAATLIAGIQRKQNSQTWGYVKWGAAAVVGLVMIANALNDNNRGSSSSSPPSTQNLPPPVPRSSLPPPQPLDPAPPIRFPTPPSGPGPEIKPARLASGFGEQPRFSIGNIRYCLFENERLERLRSRGPSTDNVFIDRFNEAIADWNAHCSSYRYLPSDMDAVRAEVRARASELSRQASERAEQWGRASLPAFAPPMVTTPTPTPAPQASMPATTSSPPIDLLDQDVARRVQVRLAELGYLKGPANGTWGPASRAAMRAFNLANRMGDTDVVTSAGMGALFAPGPIRASSPSDRLPPGFVETRYPPPPGAMLNPLNGSEAVEVHRMLRDLGFYKGRNDTLWSGASRIALREFKARNGLPPNDTWDLATEAALKAQVNDPQRASEREFQARIVGRWSTDIRSCARQQPGLPLPVVISSDRASVGGQGCDFLEKVGTGDRWFVKAVCRIDGNSWIAQITLQRSGDTLTWGSERGTTVYRRCET